MRIFSKTPNFDFVGIRKFALVLSLILFVGSIVTLTMNWLNLGLDFKGGILLEVGYPQEVKVETVRSTLSDNGFKDAVVKYIGSTNTIVTISISEQENTSKAQISNKVLEILKANSEGELEIRRREFVGAKVGAELRDDGGIAMLIAIAGILVYVMLRFEWRFAVGAITALVHDVFITLGFFSVFKWNFDLTVLAALLAVIGYSLNDTIVVYDRIRENFRKMRKGSTLQITNTSLNQTLSRTMMTSVTTLLVLGAMYFLGGELIRPFAIALIIGVIVGTYSSIFVA
ncbi:MAG: protein translocase subunit SecF, partial [Thioalkalispiraceae bacterium]